MSKEQLGKEVLEQLAATTSNAKLLLRHNGLFQQVLGAWKESLTIWILAPGRKSAFLPQGSRVSRAARLCWEFEASSGSLVWVEMGEKQIFHLGQWLREGAAKIRVGNVIPVW